MLAVTVFLSGFFMGVAGFAARFVVRAFQKALEESLDIPT